MPAGMKLRGSRLEINVSEFLVGSGILEQIICFKKTDNKIGDKAYDPFFLR